MIAAILLSSCEDIIDVDLRSVEPEVVIEGYIRMDSLAVVRITKTKDFSSTNEYIPVEDAIVKIRDSAGKEETLQLNDSGNYVAPSIRGIERYTYNLSVEYNGLEYTSVTTMPPLVPLDSLTLFDFPMIDYPTPMVHFKDPVGEENNYYRFIVYINGERYKNEYDLGSGEFMDGLYMRQRLSLHADEDDDDPVKQNDEYMVEMQCIDKDSYRFWETLMMIENSLTNPTSNIKGGALGYFSAYSYDRKSIKAVW